MWINFCEFFLLIVRYDCCICVFYIFPLILRGISTGYKRFVSENDIKDATYIQ